jgi:hypothetical protein
MPMLHMLFLRIAHILIINSPVTYLPERSRTSGAMRIEVFVEPRANDSSL